LNYLSATEIYLEILFFLLEILGEILLEFLLSLFFEGAVEVSGHKVQKSRKKRFDARVQRALISGEPEPEPPEPFSWVISVLLYFILGLAFGIISLLLFPDPFIKSADIRLIYLFAAPIAAGMVMSLVGRVRDKNGEEPIRLDNFFYGFLFALAMNLVRYYFAV
jgi:hypothetical protein